MDSAWTPSRRKSPAGWNSSVLGVAVDYSMFILARFREELLAGAPTDRAVATAMATSGTAVAFSGMTVIVSLASIWIVPVRAVQSMALAAIMVVTVAVLAAMTLLPAVLMLLGPRINALRIPGRKERPGREGFWMRWTRGVMRRPLLSALGAATLLIVLSLPAFSMVTANRSLEQLPPSTDVRVGNAILTRQITGRRHHSGVRYGIPLQTSTTRSQSRIRDI